MMPALLRRAFRTAPTSEKPVAINLGSEIAWAESRLFVGDFPKYNPDDLIGRQGYAIYRKMMLDEQVKAVVKFKRDAITARDYYFDFKTDAKLGDEEKERRIRFYDEMLDEFYKGSFCDGLNYVMKAVWQGFSISEKVLDIYVFEGTPLVGLRGLYSKPFETFGIVTDEFGGIIRVEQELEGRRQVVDLEKFVYYVHNPDMDRHYGQSDLREAYRSWYSKDVAIKLWNMFLERLAGGLVVAKPKENVTLTVQSPEYQALKAIIDHVRSMSGILLPSTVDLEVKDPKSSDAFERAMDKHDLQIAKALLVPNLLGVTHQGDTGSYSQAETQLEAFLWTLDADAARLEDAMNEQVFGPLHRMNFADGLGPRFCFKPVSETKKLEIITKWGELVSSKAVQPSDTDEAHIRELMEFPEKGEPLTPPIDPNKIPPEQGATPDDEDEPGQTVRARERAVITYGRLAMSRATRRVSFSVIERAAADLEGEGVERVAQRLEEMMEAMVARIREEKLGTPAGDVSAIESVDFRKSDKSKARREIDAMLRKAWTLGARHASDEISRARGESFSVSMARLEDVAAEFIRVSGFRMLGNLTDQMRSVVQNTLINGVKFSWTTEEIVRKVYDNLTKAGMISLRENMRVTGRLEDEVAEALQEAVGGLHRIRTAVRTNVFQALNEARYSTFTDPELGDFVEGMEYSAILDSRTTDICSSLDGRTYPRDSEEWNRIRPPNHYNCRSILVPVTIVDTEVEGKDHPSDSRWSRPSTKEPQQGFGGGVG